MSLFVKVHFKYFCLSLIFKYIFVSLLVFNKYCNIMAIFDGPDFMGLFSKVRLNIFHCDLFPIGSCSINHTSRRIFHGPDFMWLSRRSPIEPCLIIQTSNILDGLDFMWLFLKVRLKFLEAKNWTYWILFNKNFIRWPYLMAPISYDFFEGLF